MANEKVRQCVWEGVGGLKFYNSETISQPKLDGSQAQLHIVNGEPYALTSRRISTKTKLLNENIQHFPNVVVPKKLKNETIIVVEISAEHNKELFDSGKLVGKNGKPFNWDKRSNYVASIMNSKSSKNHKLVLVAFDIIMWNGLNVENAPYGYKLNLLEKYFDLYKFAPDSKSTKVYCIPSEITQNKNMVQSVFDKYIKKRLEGMVVKDIKSNKSQKIKRERDADCIIIGFTKGTGKYAQNNWIGSIVVGAFQNTPKNITGNKIGTAVVDNEVEKGCLIEVGKISGFDESLRATISESKNKYIGKVVHCKYMQWTGNKMRHPRIGDKLIRDDKMVKRCTLAQFEES